MPTLQDHFEDHAASSFARQMALGDVIGERAWGLDVQKGLLRFGDDQAYRVQLLGSHAFEPGTWLWIWANAQSNIPPQHTAAALRIRQLGEAQGIGAFTDAVGLHRMWNSHPFGVNHLRANQSLRMEPLFH